MDKRDWGWWDRLADELEQSEGPYASFKAWEEVMSAQAYGPYSDWGWWHCMDIGERIELFAAMRDLREWAEKQPKSGADS
jgi:hypothetical protein